MKVICAALVFVAVATAARCECLDDATKFAVGLCGELERSGIRTTVNGNVSANAELSNIIKRFIGASGNAGISGSVDKYEGLAREQLGKDRFDARACRQNMAIRAIEVQCHKKAVFNTCPRPEFGLDHWGSEYVGSANSGWRDGGHSQPEWCNELGAALIVQQKAGSEHQLTTLTSGEDSDKDWKGHETYNYKCSVKLQWNPVYKVLSDPLCGVAYLE